MPLRFTLGYVLLRLQRVLVNGTGEPFSRKALHWQLQCFAWAIAKLCVDDCKALRWQLQCFASEMGKTGTEIVSPILIREKGGQTLHTGHCSPQEISAEPLVLFAKQSL